MLIKITSWSDIVAQLKSTLLRFPVPIFCVFSSSLLAVYLRIDVVAPYKSDLFTLSQTLLFSSISLTSLKLLVENHRLSLRVHTIATLAILTIIVLYTWNIFSVDTNKTSYLFFSLAIIVSFLFVPYLNKNSSSASYWYFYYLSGVALFFASVSSIILGTGLSLILFSISYLFDIKIPVELYTIIWAFTCSILFALYFLSNISKEFDFEDENCGFPKGISFITNYILVPLMWVYMAILYAYFFKIIIQWQLPQGNLGWIITAFGTIGIVTKLLAFPIRNDGTRLLQLFDKYYYYALIVPIILLAIAIGIRIYDYGITETRYAVVLLGLWFTSVTVLSVINNNHFHIKYVSLIFALLAFFASFGPWGVQEMSTNSQVNRFKLALIKHGLFVNGQAVKLKGQLSFQERKELSSMTDYVTKYEYTKKQIDPWFKTLIENADPKPESYLNKNIQSKQLIALMDVEYIEYWNKTESKLERFNYYSGSSNLNMNMFDITKHDFLTRGTAHFNDKKFKPKKYNITYNNKDKIITIDQQNENIVIQVNEGEQLKFDMKQVIVELKKQHIRVINSKNRHYLTLNKTTIDKSLTVQILIERITGSISTDNEIDIRDVNYVVLFKF